MFESDFDASETVWASLSHCWGREPLVTTTRANLARHQSGIAMADLGRTFQEAVHVARALEIRFLWIDALCIIQDDIFDWKREASKMGSVYSHAVVTIAATSSRDGAGGCYSMVSTDYFEPRSIKCKLHPAAAVPSDGANDSEEAAVSTVYIRKQIDYDLTMTLQRPVNRVPYVHRKSAMQTAIPYSYHTTPLFGRGWALQERFLSPRVLHFTVHGVFLECRTCTVHETAPPPLASLPPSREAPVVRSSPRGWELLSKGADDPARFHAAWRELVEEYSLRRLTRSTDVLAALDGIAARFETELWHMAPPQGYGLAAAGLWRDDLPRGLLWTGVRWDRALARRRAPVAPTWSWASTVGAVCYSHLATGGDEVVEIATAELTPEPWGAVSDVLRLVGRVRPLALTYRKGGIGGWYVEYWCRDPAFAKGAAGEGSGEKNEAAQHDPNAHDPAIEVRVQMDYEVDQPDETAEDGAARHRDHIASGSIVHACNVVEARPKADEPSIIACLLLKRLPRGAGEYERIGYLESSKEIVHQWFRNVKRKSIRIV